jgi:spore coat protein H
MNRARPSVLWGQRHPLAGALLAWLLLWATGPLSMAAASARTHNHHDEAQSLFTNRTVLLLVIDIPKPGLESLHKDPRKYVRASLREGDTRYTNVAIHLKGSAGSFRSPDDRPGLTLSFETFEPDAPRFHGLKKIHLNNSVQDPTCLSELVCGEMFRQAGVPAARAAHALVELNGRKLGLYVVLESMNRQFLANYFQHPAGNLYGQAGHGEVTDHLERMEGDRPLTWDDLHALAAAAQESDSMKRLERLEQTLDVDRFLSFTAMEVLLGHWDGYTYASHNYRVYHDVDTSRMVFFPHDLDQLMRDVNEPILPSATGLVTQKVLEIPDLRRRYRARLRQLYTEVFVVPRLTNQVDQALSSLLPEIKTYSPDLARELQNHADGLKNRFISRGQSLEKQFAAAAARAARSTNNVPKPSNQ